MKIALVSLDQVWEDKEANRHLCIQYIKKAKDAGAQLTIFPEMTLTGFSMNTRHIQENLSDSDTIPFFKELAQEYGMAIVFGIVLGKMDKATNNMVVIDHEGNILTRYEKIHPFTFANEDQFYIGGNELATAELNGICLGCTICYDLRFPELFSALGTQCDMIINIANWPEKRVDHWHTLLKARAIENQLFIIGVNRTGTDGTGLSYVKSSSIINANGDTLSPLSSDNCLEVFEVLPEYTSNYKKSFSTTQDRKPDLYKKML